MVKVVDADPEKIALRKKRSKLLEITEGIFGNRTISTLAGDIYVKPHSPAIDGRDAIKITPEGNLITVNYASCREEAMTLARAYEEAFPGEEFVVEKNYLEK